MKQSQRQLENTRRAILDALAHVIVESKEFGFSVQQVADRAGVTHRTVYNHFPSREAMSEGLSAYLEEQLAAVAPNPDANGSLSTFPEMVSETYRAFSEHEVHCRAYVILMVSSRTPARVTRERLRMFEGVVESEAALPPELTARHVAAAIRMFVSSMGWHVLTEHVGLSSAEAAAAARWATQTLVDAVTTKPKARPERARKPPKGKPS